MAGCFTKIFLIVANIIFFLCGGFVLSVGIIALVDPQIVTDLINTVLKLTSAEIQYIIDIPQLVSTNAIFLTVLGGVIVLLGVCGCCGTVTSNKCMLGMYTAIVVLVLMFELAIIIYAAVDFNAAKSRLQKYMLTSLHEHFAPVTIALNGSVIPANTTGAVAWEQLQFEYGCCGVVDYQDFNRTVNSNFKSWNNTINNAGIIQTVEVPPSCCMQIIQYKWANDRNDFAGLMGCLTQPPRFTNTQGCYLAVMDIIAQYNYITIIIVASLIAIEVLVMLLAVNVMSVAKKKQKTGDDGYPLPDYN